MEKLITVVNSKAEECAKVCALLEQHRYRAVGLHSLVDLKTALQEGTHERIVIMDFDSFPVDNRLIRDLRNHNPKPCIVAISSRTFHPDLQEAMSTHISACLVKPVDPDELIYWLKNVC